MRVFGRGTALTNAWPLVGRELLQESRRPVNFGLRVLTAAVVVTVFAVFVSTTDLDSSQLGFALFDVLGVGLLLALWIVVPLMTADCISREKREGTLGLLFLTPMTVLDVIMGKAASHILRAATLLLASVPVLLLPFVVGGVEWQQVVIVVAMMANALLLSIAAGLYASAKGGSTIQVMMMAEGFALGLAFVSGIFQQIFDGLMGSAAWAVFLEVAAIVGFSWLVFSKVIEASVRVLRRTWSQDAAAPEQPKWVISFSGSEFWQKVFHWEHSKTLDRNPIAWLQEYSWTARLTKWGWCIGLLVAELIALAVDDGQAFLTAALSLGVAFSATGSFRRERQSGLLEMLLVTPLSARQLMTGRLWGIFCHFFPALAVLFFCWKAEQQLHQQGFDTRSMAMVIPNPLAFGALMVVGLYVSLWRMNFLLAWLLAWGVAFFLPAFCEVVLQRFEVMPDVWIVTVTLAFQVALAAGCWFLLHRNLKQRKFLSAEAG